MRFATRKEFERQERGTAAIDTNGDTTFIHLEEAVFHG